MSRDPGKAARSRCLVVWLVATGLLGGLALALLPAGIDVGGRFDAVLVDACELVLLGCAAWLWLVAGVVLADAARGVTVRRRGVPAGVRRVLLAACGAALAGGVAGGLAAPSYAGGQALAGDGDGSAAVVRGLPLPDRATAAGHLVRLLHRASEPGTDAVVVRPDDTLWGLAAEHLADPAAWPRLYRANREVVGPDPDLIHPGQRLALPRPADLREDPR